MASLSRGARTKRAIALDALFGISVITHTESPDPKTLLHAVSVLDDMVESWNNQGFLIPSIVKHRYPLVGGLSDYTIGPDGDINTPAAPISIETAIFYNGDRDKVVLTLEGPDTLSARSNRFDEEGTPYGVWYEQAFPLGTLHFALTPRAGSAIEIIGSFPLALPDDLDETIVIALGYYRAMRLNLMLDLANYYQYPVSTMTSRAAAEALDMIRSHNSGGKVNSTEPVPGFGSSAGGIAEREGATYSRRGRL